MLTLSTHTVHQRSPVKLMTKSKTRVIKRPVRSVVRVKATGIPPEVMDAQFQLVAWVLPMTIAGRLMKMEYPEIATGLVVMMATKSVLNAAGIIHY